MPRFATPDAELPRDRWGRPLITPPEGGEPVGYTRTTTFAGSLDDTTNLTKWKCRAVATGVALSAHLRVGILAASNELSDNPDNYSAKRTLNDLADRAIETSNGSSAATIGSAIHSFSERVDRGQDLDRVPEEYVADLTAYRDVLANNGIVSVAIEGFCVLDEFQVGGTYDRIFRLPDGLRAPDGTDLGAEGLDVIGDVKTGNVDYALPKIGMQLVTYAHSLDYDHRDGARKPLGTFSAVNGHEPREVSKRWSVVVHLPAGTGTAHLLWVDMVPALTALSLARDVRTYRKVGKQVSSKFATASVQAPPPLSLAEQLRAATTLDGLRGVYLANRDDFTPGLVALAADISREKGWAGQ